MAIQHPDEQAPLKQKLARILDEARSSRASHLRKLKDLSSLRSSTPTPQFFTAFSQTLTPIFTTQRRIASVERIVQFAAVFACLRDPNDAESSDGFFEMFMRFLIGGTTAANRTARFRACQIISEIIMRLPDDAEVSDELWDEVIDCIKVRVGDKVPVIRTYAVRALSRFANDAENSDILELLLETLPKEQNPDVRKTILLSLPPSNATSSAIIDCTLDVSESVRKAAYCVLASKFPLQSLSIKQRTIILKRGLADRSTAVTKECLKLMKDEWLMKSCNGDPIELLKYLDVETYESIGVSVMEALLHAGLVKLHAGQSIKQFLSSESNTTEEESYELVMVFYEYVVLSFCISGHSTEPVDAEVALYLRTLCKHLQTEAQILSFQQKKNAAEKSYVSAISKILALLRFRPTEQVPIKLMRRLLNRVSEAVSADKEVVKEVKQMAERLKASDESPDEPLESDQARLLLEKLDLQLDIGDDECAPEVEPTPLPKSTKPVRARRRTRREKVSSEEDEDEDETLQNTAAPTIPVMASVRTQRASKSAALSKMVSSIKPFVIYVSWLCAWKDEYDFHKERCRRR
ncbi:hypothetical protein CTI12_AA420700 [Artemisia annua]|uniref:Nuclear condensin complex subunit 3 C-terminal domain-containing protein n=1 Tax=Artemisia annua TaxID=35608 RepID=A0A2U1M505_ARTAN|nr:hypothetical protein CTI12_AA420700 [Artemisia annua]